MAQKLALLLATCATGVFADAPSWTGEVAPLIEKRCAGCHGGEAKMGEYSVNTYATVVSGGNHGRAVVPGRPDDSFLYQLITGKGYPRMPMDGTMLTDAETALVRRWIEAGAPGPGSGERPAKTAARPALNLRPSAKPRIFALAWQPKGDVLALAGHGMVTLASAKSRQALASLPTAAEPVRAVAFSADGTKLAAAGGVCANKGEVHIFDVASRALLTTISGHSDCIYGLAFSPDGSTIATSSYDKLIKLWDAANGNELRTLKDHIDAVYAVAFTPDGKRLVSAGADRSVKVWDVPTGRRLYTFSEATDGLNTVAVDPSGKYVAAAGFDKSVRVWRMDENGGEMLHSMMANEDAILKLVWSPDGTILVTASADGTVRSLKASDLSEIASARNQPDWVYGLAFSADGSTVAIGRMDGSLAFWTQFKGASQ
jgi:WD40 repeat protein